MGEERGCGGDSCGRGRRSCWGSDRPYSLTSLCRLTLQIDGYGSGVMRQLLFGIYSQVPLKVSILTWRLLRDRLPIKVNLSTRGIISVVDHYCVSDCGEAETAQHLFLSCSTFGSLWSLLSSWIGSSLVTAQTLPDHFVQFTISAGVIRARRSFMQLIWLVCVWVGGQNETTDCSEVQQTLHFICWTRSKKFLIGG
ncbi:hypothetical protein TSUD_16550 [Trifolium subterraneum]|uniref:Reverse transcriptase zinc-binding domain-containing protein n=1 Tax=Trifolium subterraneum TaxID=3900 RepID=A0A2Z6N9L6_TRISU|nr:hypothetical protein TSUD_16550 [Trifolium subterraneum]